MEIWLLDKDFTPLSVVDSFESLIWTDRFQEYGDFELYMGASSEALADFIPGRYFWYNGSENVMIIENIRISTDVENGDHLTVTGRSLVSILSRRIIWSQTNLTGNLQDGIEKLLNENLINPTDPNRKIDNFIFVKSEDPAITGLTLESQYMGDNLYDAITAVCAEANLGFKVTLNDANQFEFRLYSGVDHSYKQTLNPYVVFSEEFDNLVSADYKEEFSKYANVALVAGEGEGNDKKTTSVGSATGLDRREIFDDESSLSTNTSSGTMSAAEYNLALQQKGYEKIAEINKELKQFDCQIDATRTFLYVQDFYIGDLVTVANDYGLERQARILEYIQSEDVNGMKTYPKFEILDGEE